MKRKTYLFATVCCAMLSACAPQSGDKASSDGLSLITMELDNPQPLQASDLFDTILYVPLETSDTYMFSRISHLKMSREKDPYFVADKSFFLFDGETGKGKLKISKKGNGPDGYASLFDSHVDASTGEIELLDNNAKKIVVYDREGNYKRSIPLPFMSFTFTQTEKDHYWLYNNNLLSDASNHKVVHFDRNQGKIEAYDPIDKHLAEYFFIEDESNLIVQGEHLLYHYSPSDTIYQITPGKGMKAAYALDMGKNLPPKDFYARNFRDIMEFVETANKYGYVFGIPTLAANEKRIAIGCMKEGKFCITLHNKENGKNITFASFYDNHHFTTPLPLGDSNLNFCMDNEYFYFILTAEQLMECKDKGNVQKEMEQWIESKNITEFSNPILVKCKFKSEE